MLLTQIENIRSKLTPQMDVYDKLGLLWHPYLMYFHTQSFSSSHVNTDELGFRYTRFEEKNFSPLTPHFFEDCDISFIVGGSTVFGVGSSSDDQTIPSLLSTQNNQVYLNLGGRAFSSNQELILFNQVAHKFPKIKSVIIFSGLNELFLSRKSLGGGYFGNSFFGKQYNESMINAILSKKRRVLKTILHPFFGENLNYHTIDIHGLFNFFAQTLKKKAQINVENVDKFDLDFAVRQIYKNLYIFKKLSESLPFSVKFVLQPSPRWFDKQLSPEERLLFAHLDALDGNKYMSLLTKDLYLEYSSKIQDLCERLNIKFFDSNKLIAKNPASQDWLFVDRAHLTDRGNAVVADLLNSIEGGK
jgi:hypothetical protein